MDRLRFNYEEPDVTDVGADLGAPPPPPDAGAGSTRRYFSEGGYADVGDVIPGSGRPADQVEIKSTNIKPYMQNPGLAKAEADVTKARYGGSSIQDTAAPPYAEPKAAGEAGAPPVHNRTRFEKEVYNELGGNPFEINVVKQMNDITARDMPALFSKVFAGRVVWEDRGKLNKNQQAFWQEQVKTYRAHVKESLEAERKTKIDVYNHMMKTFDNDQKEQEAAEKRVKEREKEWAAKNKATLAEDKNTQKRLTDLQKNKRDILKRQSEILKNNTDLTTGQLAKEAEPEFMELANQLKLVNGEADKIMMATNPEYRAKRAKEIVPDAMAAAHTPIDYSAPSAAAATPPAAVTPPDAAGNENTPQQNAPAPAGEKLKYKPHPKGKPVEVRRSKDGRLMGKFADGSIAWLDEVKG